MIIQKLYIPNCKISSFVYVSIGKINLRFLLRRNPQRGAEKNTLFIPYTSEKKISVRVKKSYGIKKKIKTQSVCYY